MRRTLCWLGVTVVLLYSAPGCGHANYSESPADAPLFEAATGLKADTSGDLNLSAAVDDARSAKEGDTAPEPADESQLERKIIYNATLDLVVEDLSDVAGRVEELARKYGGFIAKSSIDTAPGRPRSGSWTIRVPVTRYDDFLLAAGTLGELERRTQDSREVTAEYYDLETRIRNKQLEEARLLKHLADSTGKLEDILAVEKEVARVRTEVEQMQGQLRVLRDLTALSTVTVNVREMQGYRPMESPTFGTRIGRAWRQSLDTLLTFGKAIVIAVVFIAPWLILIALPVGILLLLWRALRRRQRR